MFIKWLIFKHVIKPLEAPDFITTHDMFIKWLIFKHVIKPLEAPDFITQNDKIGIKLLHASCFMICFDSLSFGEGWGEVI